MKHLIIETPAFITAPCPHCGVEHEFEPCTLLPGIVPLCDDCGEKQTETFEAQQRAAAWRKLFAARMPDGYHTARRDQVSLILQPIFQWNQEQHRGGIGLIGSAGSGKSCAISSLIRHLKRPFLWWSGTEARDAAIDAATADKDREGTRRRWEHGMTVPILVVDDISQGKMTEAWSSKLFDLLETRMSSGLPTFWTSQIDLPDFRKKITRQNGGDDAQADAISRRLGQHSLTINA